MVCVIRHCVLTINKFKIGNLIAIRGRDIVKEQALGPRSCLKCPSSCCKSEIGKMYAKKKKKRKEKEKQDMTVPFARARAKLGGSIR